MIRKTLEACGTYCGDSSCNAASGLSLVLTTSETLGILQVRYLLHQLFVQRRGWFLTGLKGGGGAWTAFDSSSFRGTHRAAAQSLQWKSLFAKLLKGRPTTTDAVSPAKRLAWKMHWAWQADRTCGAIDPTGNARLSRSSKETKRSRPFRLAQ